MANDLNIQPVRIPPASGAEDEQERTYQVSPANLGTVKPVEDDPIQKKILLLNGKLITAEDPLIIGENFRTLTNMRYGDSSPKTIAGMTKINTTALTTYLKVRSAIHFRKTYHSDTT